MRTILIVAGLIGVLAPFAAAQTGTLDQQSPMLTNTIYNVSSTSLQWQQDVKVGIAGQLEGFELMFTAGAAGDTVDVRVRVGQGWNVGPIAWSTTWTNPGAASNQIIFFDVTSAGLTFNVGDYFVIETQGNVNASTWLNGNYVDPASGPPMYPEWLYLNAPGCFSNCGWRHGFNTYMLTGCNLSTLDSCPGPMKFKVSPCAGNVAFAYGTNLGGATIPNKKPCGGTSIDLGNPALISVEPCVGGTATLGPINIPNKACGKIHLQAVDLANCCVTNYLTL